MALIFLSVSCNSNPIQQAPLAPPNTTAASLALYTYVPVDPLPVESWNSDTCPIRDAATPELWVGERISLPDQAARIAIRQFNASGNLDIIGNNVSGDGSSFEVVLDYMNSDVTNVTVELLDNSESTTPSGVTTLDGLNTAFTINRLFGMDEIKAADVTRIIPVYVGVGFRLTATISEVKGSVNISSLSALSVAADAGRITGSLVVQTLGVTGEQISQLLPIPSELNSTTIQNAVSAMGAIKAVLYDDETHIEPRVVGFRRTFGQDNQNLLSDIVSELARSRVIWHRECKNETSTS